MSVKVVRLILFTNFIVFSAWAEKSQLERAEILTNTALCAPSRGINSIVGRQQSLVEAQELFLENKSLPQANALQILINAAQPREGEFINDLFFDISSSCPRFRTVYSHDPSTGADGFVMWGVNLFTGYADDPSTISTADVFCQYGGYRTSVHSKSRGFSAEAKAPSHALTFITSPETGHLELVAIHLDETRIPIFLTDVSCK